MSESVKYDQEMMRFISYLYLGIVIPMMLTMLYLFYRKRDRFPIKGRLASFSLAIGFGVVVYTLCVWCNNMFLADYPCSALFIHSVLGNAFITSMYGVRGIRLFYSFSLASERYTVQKQSEMVGPEIENSTSGLRPAGAETSVSDAGDAPVRKQLPASSSNRAALVSSLSENEIERLGLRNRWFMDHRKFFSFKSLMSYAFLYNVFWLVVLGIAWTIDPSDSKFRGECNWTTGNWLLTLQVAITISLMVVLALRLREVIDGFHLKEELRYTGIASVVLVILWLMIQLFIEDDSNPFPYHTISTNLIFLNVFVWSIIFPYYLVTRPATVSEVYSKNVLEGLSTLEGVLEDREARALFKKHLLMEFSIENMVFYDRVDEYREESRRLLSRVDEHKASDESKEELQVPLWAKALTVYEDCVQDGGAFEVNLPYRIRVKLVELFHPYAIPADQGSLVNYTIRRKRIERASAVDDRDREFHREMGERDYAIRIASMLDDGDLTPIDDTVFDGAQKSIFALMKRDSFQRFVRSEALSALINNRARQQQVGLQAQISNLNENAL
jgi:hypothetical protein